MVSGRKVRRWRLNGLQEEGREDYSSILLLLSEIKESLRINWAQLRSKADLQSETRHQSPSAAAGIWTATSQSECWCSHYSALPELLAAFFHQLTPGLWSFFTVFVFYEHRRINLQIIFYTCILKTQLTARPTALSLLSLSKRFKKVWGNSQWEWEWQFLIYWHVTKKTNESDKHFPRIKSV